MSIVPVEDYLETQEDEYLFDDVLQLSRTRLSPDVSYANLFFLYDMLKPYGEDAYNGCCFSD